jgi:hypothetical protein
MSLKCSDREFWAGFLCPEKNADTALSYAERFPDQLDKLVLIDSEVLGLSVAGLKGETTLYVVL